MNSAPLVTIFGGSGFVGRYIAQRMARAGWRVRVAVRRPNEALFVKPYGTVGQVEPIQANIRDDASTEAAIAGADAVINCVGILSELGKQKFQAVQTEGAARIAKFAAKHGVTKFVHISAIGADAQSDSAYARSKAEGEAAVLGAVPTATILRPSIVFGNEDEFFNRFAQMSRFSPVLPLVGANTKFQPVFVGDVAEAAEIAVVKGRSGVFELGGPEIASFRELMQKMLNVIRRKRIVLGLPTFAGRIMAGVFGLIQFLTGGLIPNTVITSDQVKQLAQDNIVSDEARGLADLGIAATDMDAVLESYLYCYRPAGQFTALTESGEQLRKS
jgi:NADH dehydrogenase